MRRIAILVMTIVAVVSSGCGWKANLDWCEKGGCDDKTYSGTVGNARPNGQRVELEHTDSP